MKCKEFEPLIKDMKDHDIDKEHYNFDFNGFRFDVILSIVQSGYEILVAIHTENWGCVLNMNNDYYVEVPDDVYYSLRDILHLDWNTNHFNSIAFLQLLSEKSPQHSNCLGVGYTELRRYLPYRHVDEADKIYFCGWNDHKRDGRKAHNFDKTEFYFGNEVACYCRRHNISSLWSDIPRDERKVSKPWVSFLTDSLTGVLKNDYDDKKLRAERIEARESSD